MNKKLIIAGVVLLLILGGAGIAFMNQKKGADKNSVSNTETSSEVKSLKDLLGLNNQECSFTDSENSSSGKIYAGNGKFSGEFNSQIEGKASVSHVVADGTNIYFWIDGQTQGFMATQPSIENLSGGAVAQALDMNTKVDYSCKPWVFSTSQFNVPQNIKFTDYSKLIPSPTSVPSGATESQPNCSVCNSLSGESKTQCLAALKCS